MITDISKERQTKILENALDWFRNILKPKNC